MYYNLYHIYIYMIYIYMRHGEYLLSRRYALGKLGRPLSVSMSCNIYMYILDILGVSFFRASPIVFQLNTFKTLLKNVTSNHETIHDNLQHGSNIEIVQVVYIILNPHHHSSPLEYLATLLYQQFQHFRDRWFPP